MAEKIKTGELRVAIEKEEAIWCDKKRIVFFGMPLSFTKYTLTPSKFTLEKGFFKKTEDETRLYRITDVSLTRGFWERIFGLGTIKLLSSDTSTPKIELHHVKNPKTVKDVLSQAIEDCRRANGVRTSEVVGTMPRPMGAHTHAAHAPGPELVPDFNHNGIDDRNE